MGEKFRGGFVEYNSGDDDSGDNDSSNIVNFEGWKRDHGYQALEEVASSDTASESVGPDTTSETTDTKNKDSLLLGQVKLENESLFSAEKLLELVKTGIKAIIGTGNVPPILAGVISIGVDGVFDSKPVKTFVKNVDNFELDDFRMQREIKKAREQEKMAREAGQPTPNQA